MRLLEVEYLNKKKSELNLTESSASLPNHEYVNTLNYYSVCCRENRKYVAIASHYNTSDSNDRGCIIAVSTDQNLITWSKNSTTEAKQQALDKLYLTFVTYNYSGHKYIAVGYFGHIIKSDDFPEYSWSDPVQKTVLKNKKIIGCTRATDSIIVALSETGETFYSIGVMDGTYENTLGDTWVKMSTIPLLPDEATNSNSWIKITYDNERYIALNKRGYISYVRRTDSDISYTDWSTPVSVLPEDENIGFWCGIAYGKDTYIALSRLGYVSYSTDLFNWSSPTKLLSNYYLCLEYFEGEDRFVAIGGVGGRTITAPNATPNWVVATG